MADELGPHARHTPRGECLIAAVSHGHRSTTLLCSLRVKGLDGVTGRPLA